MSNRLISGLMKIKPNIKEFTEHGVIWEDGTTTEHVSFLSSKNIGLGVDFTDDAYRLIMSSYQLAIISVFHSWRRANSFRCKTMK